MLDSENFSQKELNVALWRSLRNPFKFGAALSMTSAEIRKKNQNIRETIELLLKAGADSNMELRFDEKPFSAIAMAQSNSLDAAIDLLIQYGGTNVNGLTSKQKKESKLLVRDISKRRQELGDKSPIDEQLEKLTIKPKKTDF